MHFSGLGSLVGAMEKHTGRHIVHDSAVGVRAGTSGSGMALCGCMHTDMQ